MIGQEAQALLAGISPAQFVGRRDELDRLAAHAIAAAPPFGLRLASAPSVGASELLRQTYDHIFHERRDIVPFYFALRPGDLTAAGAARRYIQQFLLQTVASRRNDARLLAASLEFGQLSKLAPPADAYWIDNLKEICGGDALNDERSCIRAALSAPLRAATAGLRVFVMVDDLHESLSLDGGNAFIDDLSAVFSHASIPFVFSARRRFAIPGLYLQTMSLGPLGHDDSASLAENLAAGGTRITEQTRDLIAVQFGGNPSLIRLLVDAARQGERPLASFRDVEQLYSDELLAGGIGDYFDRMLERATRDPSARRKLVETLYFAREPGDARFPLDALRDRLGLGPDDLRRLAAALDTDEVIETDTTSATVARDPVLHDYLEARYRLDHPPVTPASVAASIVTNALKRAPQLMAREYRRASAVGLQEVLQSFDLQQVPLGLLDYRIFRDQYKGTSDDEIRAQLSEEKDKIVLPQISHVASAEAHYPPISALIESERTAVGIGFSDRTYRDEDQVVWIAAEIDSKLEANRELTEEWCNRLEALAAACSFVHFRIWLVSPEGFDEDALVLLADRGGYGSSRRQVDLLKPFITGGVDSGNTAATEYEMVIPVGDDTELIAAHALEEIARRHNFPAKAINQIKTALVEACINAVEHSLSPDRRIYQKFAVDNEKIVITVSNRGLRLADKPAAEVNPNEGRRGWGLNLMRGLMDEVRVDSVDDGTRITMTKYLKHSAASGAQ